MEPRILKLESKKFIGISLSMTLSDNKTAELWRSFMPRRKEISDPVNNDLISLQVYTEPLRPGDMNQVFQKWSLVEVKEFRTIPAGMQKFELDGSLYAVFHYKGLNTDNNIFRYIYGTWLPSSKYVLDQRPSFEVLGEKYKNNDRESEEEIWVPVRLKE